MQQIMNDEHPRWEEFLERLEGPEGCDFRDWQSDEPKPEGYSKVTWRCAGGKDKTYATVILTDMGDIDIPASLSFFDEHGGHYDCEILFNVA